MKATLQPVVWMWVECGCIHECLAVCVCFLYDCWGLPLMCQKAITLTDVMLSYPSMMKAPETNCSERWINFVDAAVVKFI